MNHWEQLDEQQRECLDALKGYLERQLVRLQQTKKAIEEEKRHEEKQVLDALYNPEPCQPDAISRQEALALERENEELKESLALVRQQAVRLQSELDKEKMRKPAVGKRVGGSGKERSDSDGEVWFLLIP